MYGKFNITKLGRRDQILLGIPWLRAMNPIIDWAAETLVLPRTEKSDEIEIDLDTDRKKNGLPRLFNHHTRWQHSRLPKPFIASPADVPEDPEPEVRTPRTAE